MSYATAADLLERYESDLLAQRAAPEGTRVSGVLLALTVSGGDRSAFTADEIAAADLGLARIEEALSDAVGVVDSYLSTKYTLPLSPVPRLIRRLTCDIARYFLWGDSASIDGVEDREYKAALKTLASIRDGEQQLGVQPEPTAPASGVAAELIHVEERLFTRDSMRGL